MFQQQCHMECCNLAEAYVNLVYLHNLKVLENFRGSSMYKYYYIYIIGVKGLETEFRRANAEQHIYKKICSTHPLCHRCSAEMEARVYFEYVNFFDLEGRQKLHSGHRKIMPHYISTKSKGIILITDEWEDLSKDTFLISVKHR